MLTVGATLEDRFLLHRALGADAEGEDFMARRVDAPGYARIRVLAADDALRAAAGSAAAVVERIAALELTGLARPLAAGVDPATGRVWFAEAWTNGQPRCAPGAWGWEDAHGALLAAAEVLDPARARGVVHGRLAPGLVLVNVGTPAIIGVAAGVWLGEVRPAGPGGDLGCAARAIRALVAAPAPELRAWGARCEQEPPAFGSLDEALRVMPLPGRRRAEIDQERLEAAAREQEREREEAARRWREAREADIRAGRLPPDDLSGRDAASWPVVFARVQQVLGAAPVTIEATAASGLGLRWPLRETSVASAWQQARGVVGALRALAGGGKRLGTDRDKDARALLDAVAARLGLTPVRPAVGYGPTTEWERSVAPAGEGIPPGILGGHFGGPRIAMRHGALDVGPTILGWQSSHHQGPVLSSHGSIALADLPRKPAAAADVIAALLAAAAAVDLSRLMYATTCRFCGGRFASVDRHDDSCCHRCAEIHLGVIH